MKKTMAKEKIEKLELESVENTPKEELTEANTERKFQEEDKRMKAILDREPKVPIFIPVDELNPNSTQVVGINGVIYSIPRGKEVLVPKPVKEIWEESYQKTMIAKSKIRISELDVQVFD